MHPSSVPTGACGRTPAITRRPSLLRVGRASPTSGSGPCRSSTEPRRATGSASSNEISSLANCYGSEVACAGVVDWASASIGPSVDVGHFRANFFLYEPELAEPFTTSWETLSGSAYNPWADIVALIGLLDGFRASPPCPSARRAIEGALARAVAELAIPVAANSHPPSTLALWQHAGVAPVPQPASSVDWLLDEVASAGGENLDHSHASRYDSKEDADAAAEVAVCQELGITADSTVVDLGAGTGQFTTAVAPHCRRVIAVDVSPVMLDQLRAKVLRAALTNVHVVEAGFLTYRHEGPPADLVYSRYALHHLPDFWKAMALTRLHHVLRPGGVLRLWDVVYSFEPIDAEQRLEAWCASVHPDRGDEEWKRADVAEHVRDEDSTFTWLLEPIMERTGFRIEEATYSDDGVFAKYVLRKP